MIFPEDYLSSEMRSEPVSGENVLAFTSLSVLIPPICYHTLLFLLFVTKCGPSFPLCANACVCVGVSFRMCVCFSLPLSLPPSPFSLVFSFISFYGDLMNPQLKRK